MRRPNSSDASHKPYDQAVVLTVGVAVAVVAPAAWYCDMNCEISELEPPPCP
jgi:hypothetical protein